MSSSSVIGHNLVDRLNSVPIILILRLLIYNHQSLGIWFDSTLSFRHHFLMTAEKAGRVVAYLSHLMRNLGGPREARRRLMMSTALSILLYGAPVWADYVKTPN